MKSFITSIVCLSLLVGGWAIYNYYSDNVLHSFINEIEDNIIIAVEAENWDSADRDFDTLSDKWHDYKKAACFFFETDALNDTDYTIARAKYYIHAKDVSNASGELACLKEQFTFLHFNESIKLQNIF